MSRALVRDVARIMMQTALAVHIAITVLDNIPENQVSLGIRLPAFRKIPQWRFFAPNPGMEDIYLMYRTRDTATEWSPWKDIPLQVKQAPMNFVWNPGSRSFKALFDATEQLRRLAAYRAPDDFVYDSEGYNLVADFVESTALADRNADDTEIRYQFMLLSSLPGATPNAAPQPRPILVSPARQAGRARGGVG